MPWFSRSKDSKKGHREQTQGLFDGGRPRGMPWQDDKNSRHSLDLVSDTGSGTGKGSRSPSPSSPSNNSSSKGGGGGGRHSRGQPLPLPCAPPMKAMERTYSASQLPSSQTQSPTALHHAPSMPLPSPTQLARMESTTEGDYPSGSVSSVSSLGSADVDTRQQARVSNLRPMQETEPFDQMRPSPQMGQASSAPRGRVLRPHEATRLETSRSTSPLPGSHPPATSPTSRVWAPIWQAEGLYPAPLKIPQPDSSMSSPAPSPRAILHAQRTNMEPMDLSGFASPHSG